MTVEHVVGRVGHEGNVGLGCDLSEDSHRRSVDSIGDIGLVFDELGVKVGVPYPLPMTDGELPRRIPACPSCGDTERVRCILYGMPAAPPEMLDESRIVFAGCVVDGIVYEWQCPSCGLDYDAPRRNRDNDWEFEATT